MQLPITKTDVTATFQAALSDASQEANSLHFHVEAVSGRLATKTLTADGTGAQNDNLFLVTGSVLITGLHAECLVATNATTFSTAYYDLYDGTAALEISDNGGTDLSGILAGGMIYRDAVATSPLTFLSNAAGAFEDGGGGGYYQLAAPFRLTAKSGVATYIRFNFTGDADTNVSMKHYIMFVPKSTGATITAV